MECAKTFLLFHPGDEVMKDNLAYYSVMLGEDKAQAIAPRQVKRARFHLLVRVRSLGSTLSWTLGWSSVTRGRCSRGESGSPPSCRSRVHQCVR